MNMDMNRTTIAVLVAAAFSLSACGSGGGGSEPQAATTPTPVVTTPPADAVTAPAPPPTPVAVPVQDPVPAPPPPEPVLQPAPTSLVGPITQLTCKRTVSTLNGLLTDYYSVTARMDGDRALINGTFLPEYSWGPYRGALVWTTEATGDGTGSTLYTLADPEYTRAASWVATPDKFVLRYEQDVSSSTRINCTI